MSVLRSSLPFLTTRLAGCLIFLAACGNPANRGGNANPPAPTQTDANGPSEERAQRVEPVPGQVDVRPVMWERAKAQGRTVRLFFWSGVEPCNILDRVDVVESERKVTITLFEGRAPTDEDVACIEIAVYKYTEVTLSEPVGDRKIVDGARLQD